MNSMKNKSALLMTKGIVDMRNDPPRLVCTILTFKHPSNNKEVTLLPIPNMASPAYFSRILDGAKLTTSFDKVLCEDGRLPFRTGSTEASKQRFLRKVTPFFCFRPVVENADKFDGLIARDALESRMAYQMVVDGWEPTVDPRARRGVERLETYPDGTRVAVPWSVYHMPYFRDRLLRDGWTQTNVEEVTITSFRDVFMAMLGVSAVGFVLVFTFVFLMFMI